MSDSLCKNVESDMIKVGELTPYEINVWKFPNTNICPLRSCQMGFSTRDLAITHYKEFHAKHSALCKHCNYPLMLLKGLHHFQTHFLRKHPGETVPPKVKNFQLKCSLCGVIYKTYGTLVAHLKSIHKRLDINSELIQTFLMPNEDPSTDSNSGSANQTMDRPEAKSPSWEDVESDVSSFSNKSIESDTNSKAKRKVIRSKMAKLNQQKDCKNSSNKNHVCSIRKFVRHLGSYAMACSHYRTAHGRTVSECTFCKRYFTNQIKFLRHMEKNHPEANKVCRYAMQLPEIWPKKSKTKNHNEVAINVSKTPSVTFKPIENCGSENKKRIKDTQKSKQAREKVQIIRSEDANDIIIIGESSGFQSMCWPFPQTENCPKDSCNMRFSSREAAIQHYRKKHAKMDLMCKECGALITMSSSHNMSGHYKRKHPNHEPPQKLVKKHVSIGSVEIITGEKFQVKQGHSNRKSPISKPNSILKRKNNEPIAEKTNVTKSTANIPNSLINQSVSVAIGPRVTVSTVDLSNDQDDFVDKLLTEASSANTSTSKVNETSRKETIAIDQPKSSHTNEQNTVLSKRNHRVRSTGTRQRGCTLCGKGLLSYFDACEHYLTSHGRNVLMCPYCELYFLQAAQMIKHILAEHSKCDVPNEVQDEIETDANSHSSNVEQTHQRNDASLNVRTEPTNDTKQMETNTNIDFNDDRPDDQPLNLSMRHIHDPMEVDGQPEIIDLTTGALDLRKK